MSRRNGIASARTSCSAHGEEGATAEVQLLHTGNTADRTAQAITQEARRWGADLLVAGTHGRSGLKHLLMGSVAEGIVRHTPVPVLLVRA
jgi:nucleotide-binding universal stress UspA family protein